MSNKDPIDDMPPRLKLLFDALDGKGEVSVSSLYETLFGKNDKTEREQMQRLGTYVSRLNDKLEEIGLIVEPGRLKYTYTLNPF